MLHYVASIFPWVLRILDELPGQRRLVGLWLRSWPTRPPPMRCRCVASELRFRLRDLKGISHRLRRVGLVPCPPSLPARCWALSLRVRLQSRGEISYRNCRSKLPLCAGRREIQYLFVLSQGLPLECDEGPLRLSQTQTSIQGSSYFAG